jgi:hypothetical protein
MHEWHASMSDGRVSAIAQRSLSSSSVSHTNATGLNRSGGSISSTLILYHP